MTSKNVSLLAVIVVVALISYPSTYLLSIGRFVEHGEYEKNYYGTSFAAIEAVVQSGKTCILNLHVHSIPLLRQGQAGKWSLSPPLLHNDSILSILTDDSDSSSKQVRNCGPSSCLSRRQPSPRAYTVCSR